MKKVIDFVKKSVTVTRDWLVANGIEGVAGLAAGLILWSIGYKIFAGFSFGVFATRNWDLAKNWLLKKLNK